MFHVFKTSDTVVSNSEKFQITVHQQKYHSLHDILFEWSLTDFQYLFRNFHLLGENSYFEPPTGWSKSQELLSFFTISQLTNDRGDFKLDLQTQSLPDQVYCNHSMRWASGLDLIFSIDLPMPSPSYAPRTKQPWLVLHNQTKS